MKRSQRVIKTRSIRPSIPKIFNKKVFLWLLTILCIVLVIVNLFIYPLLRKSSKSRIRQNKRLEITSTVHRVLSQFEIDSTRISPRDTLSQVIVPQEFPFFQFYASLREHLQSLDGTILDCVKQGNSILMVIGYRQHEAERYVFVPSRAVQISEGNVAIIIDDFGYSFNALVRDFLTLEAPITISIIPGLKYTKKIEEIAGLHNKEILVHMPMEPLYEEVKDNGFYLFTGQDPGRTSLRVRQAFAQIPLANGMNNHQGSKATMDSALMSIVMFTLQDMEKYFIDSRTHSESIAYRVAQKLGLPSGENKLFLDDRDDDEFITSQLELAATLAKEQGSAIAIGHVRKNTFDVLQKNIPSLQSKGITLVYASALLN